MGFTGQDRAFRRESLAALKNMSWGRRDRLTLAPLRFLYGGSTIAMRRRTCARALASWAIGRETRWQDCFFWRAWPLLLPGRRPSPAGLSGDERRFRIGARAAGALLPSPTPVSA